MPEGDILWQTAARLRPVLEGQELLELHAHDRGLCEAALVGHSVRRVEARGKNLLISFDDGRTLHCHLRMRGRWRVVAGRGPVPRVERAQLALRTRQGWALCHEAAILRLLARHEVTRDPLLSRLGPDLLHPDFDVQIAADRLGSAAELQLGEALLQQRLVAGIGNVYKSEVLFLAHLSPFRTVGETTDEERRTLLGRARRLLRENVERPIRRSVPGPERPRHWVYRRAGLPCQRCGTPIEHTRQGNDARSTYWCPSCQR